ncbi:MULTISPECIES: MarC family protein [unclassified Iodidimonas]|jgi:multiple antibiotic resistance protein|uniref:MarC family protein n=1 Tax=unclassified Iodidimonas TaxID=2626145 RepID=UPI002482EC5B|nr:MULTISPECIES: MarC family protein [unclassified Iodidimonas]
MLELFISAFVTFFVVIDPIGIAPVFASLTRGSDARHKKLMAIKGTVIAVVILAFFAAVGEPFLSALGISLDALKVAGGIMLFLIALEMVFEKRTERREETAERTHQEHLEDISVFPIAIPLLAGPGAIASIILLMASHEGNLLAQGSILGALGLTLLLTLLAFLAASKLMAVLGATVSAVVSRVLGIILAAFATQFIMDGIRLFFAA